MVDARIKYNIICIIMYEDDHNRKINEFKNANNFTKLPNDITNNE
jgi:hypothetical protein